MNVENDKLEQQKPDTEAEPKTAVQTVSAKGYEPLQDVTIPTNRYYFPIDSENLSIPRLGIGASAIVLDGVDRKTGGNVAVKFVHTYKGTAPIAETETRERFFDREILKTKSLANDPYLLEYLDDELLHHDQLVVLSSSAGTSAYDIKLIQADVAGNAVEQALQELNQYIESKPSNDLEDFQWNIELYRLRHSLRQAIRDLGDTQFSNVQVLNGQRLMVIKKYQTTLSRLLMQHELSVDEKLDLVLELLKALKQIHLSGIIHADICPDNIMFRLSSKQDIDLMQDLRQQGVSTRYLYELQSVLIDLGRVVKDDMRGQDQIPYGLPIKEANNRVVYAAPETMFISERLPFERYNVTYKEGQLVLEPLWEFDEYTDEDNWLGQISNEKGEGQHKDSNSMYHLENYFVAGDILFNSTWGFVVKEVEDNRVILSNDDIYKPDAEHYTLMKESIDAFLQNSNDGTWEFDDILYVNFQQGIPADIFAIGMVIVETFVGEKIKASGLRDFSNSCKRLLVGGRTPQELMDERDFQRIYEAFRDLGLEDMFALVLKCVIRGDKSLGYYCSSHSDSSASATVRLLQDYSQIMHQFSALLVNNVLQHKLVALSQQLDEYKNVFGHNADRSEIFKEVGLTKEHLEKMEEDFKNKSNEFAELTKVLQNTEATLQQTQSSQKNLQSEKSDILDDLGSKKSTIEQNLSDLKALREEKYTLQDDKDKLEAKLNQRLNKLKEEKAELTETMEHLKTSLGDFVEEFGDEFRRTVKAWGSRKKAAAMLQEFRDTLFSEK
jgi:serine/threonine protein kinase